MREIGYEFVLRPPGGKRVSLLLERREEPIFCMEEALFEEVTRAYHLFNVYLHIKIKVINTILPF